MFTHGSYLVIIGREVTACSDHVAVVVATHR